MPGAEDAREAEARDLLTGVLLAGEALAAEWHPACRPPPGEACPPELAAYGPLVELARSMEALLEAQPQLRQLADGFQQALGDGEALRLLYRNLFPPATPAPGADPRRLTPQQVKVLTRAAEDLSHEEIGAVLGISPRTVGTHLENAYKKLGVRRPMQALARAAALGYVDFDAVWSELRMARSHSRGVDTFRFFCASVGCGMPLDQGGALVLAKLGLLLLAVSAAAARQVDGDMHATARARGALCRLGPDGEVRSLTRTDHLGPARAIAIAPPASAARGFRPGHLFLVQDRPSQRLLDRATVSEFTEDGKWLRELHGGGDLHTRLAGGPGLAFAPDGCLLVISGWLTDAVLRFDEGGRRIRRLFEGDFRQLSLMGGRIYAAEDTPTGGSLRVFDAEGHPLENLADNPWHGYHGLAADSHGHLFAVRDHSGQREICELSAEGALIRKFPVAGLHGGMLAVDASDRLYVPCELSGEVRVLVDGAAVRVLALPEGMKPYATAPTPDGGLWVSGWLI